MFDVKYELQLQWHWHISDFFLLPSQEQHKHFVIKRENLQNILKNNNGVKELKLSELCQGGVRVERVEKRGD